jgi:Nup93/Nic96
MIFVYSLYNCIAEFNESLKKTHKLVHFQVMQDLRFLPLTPDAVEQKVSAFRGYSDEIRRVLPEVLLAMMTILLNQYRAK